MSPLLNVATAAAEAAGQIIMRQRNFTDRIAVERKAAHDLVSATDHEAEQVILEQLYQAHPDHSFHTEEGTVEPTPGAEFEWVIDPLDGTTNFLYGIPHYAVSLALLERGKLRLGVVYDPFKQEMFTAEAGHGAYVNQRRLRVRDRDRLDDALLATGIPFRDGVDYAQYWPTLHALAPHALGVRRLGSAALDLAYVAAGRFQGFWEYGLHTWDVAAGILLVREAGGIVESLTAGDPVDTGDILAAPPQVLAAMRQHLPEGSTP